MTTVANRFASLPRAARVAAWILAGLAAIVVLALLAATLLLPGWVTGRGAALASEALGRPVSIDAAHFQPWRLGLVVEGVKVGGATAQDAPLFTLAKLDAALSLRSLLRGRAVVASVGLTKPELRVARLAEGHYDIDDLIQRFTAKPAAAKNEASEPEFAVYNIRVDEGLLQFDDRPVKRRHEIAALRLALPFVSTIDADEAVEVEPTLSGRLDGVPFDSHAEALPFADKPSARLAFKLAGLDLAPLGAYVPASAPLRLKQGSLDVNLALDFAEHAGQPATAKLSGELQLHDLALNQPDGQPLLSLKRLALPLADVQPLRRQVSLGAVKLESPSAWLYPLPKSERVAAPSETQPGPPWRFALAGLEVQDGRLTAWDLALEAITLKLGPAAWPLAQPVLADASLRLDQATLAAHAKLAPDLLEADAALNGLALERLAAWLPLPGQAKLAAGVSAKARLSVKDPLAAAATDRAQLALSELDVRDARLSLPGASKPLLTLAGAQLDQASIEPGAHRIQLGTLKLDAPRAQLARSRDGRLSFAPLLPAAEAAPAKPAVKPVANEAAWALQLAGLQVERAALRWRDEAVPAGSLPVALAVEPLRLQLGAAGWPASKTPVSLQLNAQLAPLGANDQPIKVGGGSLDWRGKLGLAPLSAQGRLQARALPLQLFDAYLDPAWGLHLQRADLGLKADLAATQKGGDWQASVDGDVRIGPLAVQQTRQIDGERVVGEDLLSWQVLQLDGVKLALTPQTPLRVAVRDASLDQAYARLIVDDKGRFNLRDVGPAGAASAPASAASASAPAPAPEISVERIRVAGTSVDFNDHFVRPNYSAKLTDLQGSLGAFSTAGTQLAPLTLRGKVAGTGLLEIDGQLKPGAPLAMDVAANATDIELAPLSPYAGKYAGYAIERGKLSTKLRYKIEPGGQLNASNQIILNQLTFGDKVDSPEATTLPVRFAVSLLKDRNGVIDVNLPVSGSLNDPQFSVGGIVWKLILNLIGKALTAPFALFSGSDSPQASEIAFAPGSAELAAIDQLDRVAKLLQDKPGVQLTLTGWADPAGEAQAIRELRLGNALKAENAASPDEALKRLYQATKLPNKPRNLIGMAKDLPPDQMRALLMASYQVDEEALRQLAVARAVAARDALLARGAPNERVFLGAPKLCAGACGSDWRPHVEMSLGAH